MKNNILKSKFIAKFIFVIAFAGLFVASNAWAKVFTVKLAPDSGQTELVATSVGKCAPGRNHKGCFDVPKGKKADINFILSGNRKKCNLADGARWELSAVYLGGKNSSSKPTSWGNLDSEVQSDFDVADASSGLLNHARGSNAQHIKISNKNQYRYDIWYTVMANCVATNGSTLRTIEVDPRIGNGGK